MSMDKKRWIILALQIVIGVVTMFVYLLANFVGPLNEVKGWSVGSMMFVFTAMMWISPVAMIVGGKLRDIFGNRKLIIAIGIFYGVSICLSVLFKYVLGFVIFGGFCAAFSMFAVFVAQLANIGLLFPDRRGFAMGLYNAGCGFGLAAITMPVVFLIEKITIIPAIITLGIAMGGLTVVCGLFIIDPEIGYKPAGWNPEKNESIKRISKNINYSWQEMVKTPTYYFLMLSMVGLQIGGTGISANVSLMAQSALGVTAIGGGLYATLASTSSGLGGLVAGTVADKLGVPRTLIALGLFNILAVGLYLTVGQGKPIFFGLVILALMIGYVGQSTVMSVGAMNIYGEKNFGVNMGIIGLSGLIGSLIGPQVAGNASVNTTFEVACVSAATTVLFAVLLSISLSKMTKRNTGMEAEMRESE